jgi:Kef-type K+ transport system membrane component KefB
MTAGHSLLYDIGLSILAATACSHVARLARQPLLIGYVAGGVLLGSHIGFGWVTDVHSVELISEIGLLLLLFIIGLEIHLPDLKKMGAKMLILGAAQFFLCLALGYAAVSSGGGRFDRLYLAVGLALSSTLIVVKLLHDKFELTTTAGRLTVGVLVLQDVWAIAFMALQPSLTRPELGTIAKSLFFGVGLVAGAFLFSRFALSRILARAGRTPELVLLTSVAWCFLLGGLAQKAGLSKEMGALIAGLSIAAFPYGADVIAKLAGVRDFFVTLFFVSLGLKIPVPTPALIWGSLQLCAVVIATRLFSVAPVAARLGYGWRVGVVTALNIAQISEFALVIMALGAGYGHVSESAASLTLSAMLLAAVLSTYIIQFNDRLARWIVIGLEKVGLCADRPLESDSSEAASAGRDIVILGFFREGESLIHEMRQSAPALVERTLIVDYNPAHRRRLEELGFKWAYADLAHPETLQHLHIGHASVILCTVSDTFLKGITNRRLLGQLKKMCSKAKYVMCADERREAEKLLQDGAAHVVVSSELAGGDYLRVLASEPAAT